MCPKGILNSTFYNLKLAFSISVFVHAYFAIA